MKKILVLAMFFTLLTAEALDRYIAGARSAITNFTADPRGYVDNIVQQVTGRSLAELKVEDYITLKSLGYNAIVLLAWYYNRPTYLSEEEMQRRLRDLGLLNIESTVPSVSSVAEPAPSSSSGWWNSLRNWGSIGTAAALGGLGWYLTRSKKVYEPIQESHNVEFEEVVPQEVPAVVLSEESTLTTQYKPISEIHNVEFKEVPAIVSLTEDEERYSKDALLAIYTAAEDARRSLDAQVAAEPSEMLQQAIAKVKKPLIVTDSYDINVLDAMGRTRLMIVAKEGEYFMAQQLLQQGADPNIQDVNGATALMLNALFARNASLIKLLLRHGADANMQDAHGRTALMYAAANAEQDEQGSFRLQNSILEDLIEKGKADITVKDNNGLNVLTYVPRDLQLQSRVNYLYNKLKQYYIPDGRAVEFSMIIQQMKSTPPPKIETSDVEYSGAAQSIE